VVLQQDGKARRSSSRLSNISFYENSPLGFEICTGHDLFTFLLLIKRVGRPWQGAEATVAFVSESRKESAPIASTWHCVSVLLDSVVHCTGPSRLSEERPAGEIVDVGEFRFTLFVVDYGPFQKYGVLASDIPNTMSPANRSTMGRRFLDGNQIRVSTT
jgi:hypothetical protein